MKIVGKLCWGAGLLREVDRWFEFSVFRMKITNVIFDESLGKYFADLFCFLRKLFILSFSRRFSNLNCSASNSMNAPINCCEQKPKRFSSNFSTIPTLYRNAKCSWTEAILLTHNFSQPQHSQSWCRGMFRD